MEQVEVGVGKKVDGKFYLTHPAHPAATWVGGIHATCRGQPISVVESYVASWRAIGSGPGLFEPVPARLLLTARIGLSL